MESNQNWISNGLKASFTTRWMPSNNIWGKGAMLYKYYNTDGKIGIVKKIMRKICYLQLLIIWADHMIIFPCGILGLQCPYMLIFAQIKRKYFVNFNFLLRIYISACIEMYICHTHSPSYCHFNISKGLIYFPYN